MQTKNVLQSKALMVSLAICTGAVRIILRSFATSSAALKAHEVNRQGYSLADFSCAQPFTNSIFTSPLLQVTSSVFSPPVLLSGRVLLPLFISL